MIHLNKKLSEITPERLYKAVKRRMENIFHWTSWSLPLESSIENKNKLLRFKEIHRGKRCFILANGPSLRHMDLSLLKGEITIGMNRIYLMKDINGFVPNYLVVSDVDIQLRQFTKEYNDIGLMRFYNWNARKLFTPAENLVFFKESFSPRFQKDFTQIIGSGKSVTYACLQLAYFMGLAEVILIGKDHKYNVSGVPHISVCSDGQEENHFIRGYYQKGMKWDIPDYLGEEYSYRLARESFESDGRKIFDATIGGNLDVFNKIDFYTLFDQ